MWDLNVKEECAKEQQYKDLNQHGQKDQEGLSNEETNR
jgi:hypothetical protein